MTVSDQSLLPRFLLTLHNAYFQDDDFSEFTGRAQIGGELYRALRDTKYAYLPLIGMLAIIETLGSLLADKKGIQNNIKTFFELFMPTYLPHLKIFYNLRNTVVHDWDGGLEVDLDTVQPVSHHLVVRGKRFVVSIPQLYADLSKGFNEMKNQTEKDRNFAVAVTARLKTKVGNAGLKV